jgi:hypothetical protein
MAALDPLPGFYVAVARAGAVRSTAQAAAIVLYDQNPALYPNLAAAFAAADQQYFQTVLNTAQSMGVLVPNVQVALGQIPPN